MKRTLAVLVMTAFATLSYAQPSGDSGSSGWASGVWAGDHAFIAPAP
jgi:hypothetical protein